MNKAEMIERVAQKLGIPGKDVRATVDAIFDTDPAGVIPDILAQGGKVTISGFGTFECRTRRARQGRNPRTGEVLSIPASKAPVFKAGKPLKDLLRG